MMHAGSPSVSVLLRQRVYSLTPLELLAQILEWESVEAAVSRLYKIQIRATALSKLDGVFKSTIP